MAKYCVEVRSSKEERDTQKLVVHAKTRKQAGKKAEEIYIKLATKLQKATETDQLIIESIVRLD